MTSAAHSTPPLRGSAQGKLWRNRITRHADVDPTTLISNPANWRVHPKHQADALAGVLSEVGYVQSVIVNEASGRIVDGHLRVALAVERGDPSVPVVYVDLADDEERLILATLDPIGALAETDAAALSTLLDSVTPTADGLADLLASLRPETTVEPEPPAEFPSFGHDIEIEHRCPSCGYEWSGQPS